MFVRVHRKTYGNGVEHLYASVVENIREGGKTVQKTVVYLGVVTEDQVPFLKAAYATVKPRLVWDDDNDNSRR